MRGNQTSRTKRLLDRLTDGRGDELERLLSPGRVVIEVREDVLSVAQAQLCVSFAVNLLARLHPVVQELHIILPADAPVATRLPRWIAPTIKDHLTVLLQSISSPVVWSITERQGERAGVALVIGRSERGELDADATVFFGAEGWNAYLSPNGPVPTSGRVNPIGAYASASIAVAEVWKRLLYPHRHLMQGRPLVPTDEPLTFSTFTYRTGETEPNPDLPEVIELKKLTWIGLGAGGGAAAYTLASMPAVRGSLITVEPDGIEDTNLNRYVFADSHDATSEVKKTEVVEALFVDHRQVNVRSFPKSFSEAASELSADDFRHVVAAVHSREARRQIQLETPEVLWDAGATEDGEFWVWRLVFGVTECMTCKHPPGEEDPEVLKARQLEQLLGLDTQTWLKKLRDNARFTGTECVAMEQHVSGQDLPFDLPREGQAFGDWEASQCGRLRLPGLDEEIPVPFAPVMAGVLLAGEIVKQHHFPEAVLDSYYWNTLVGQFMRRNRPARRLPRPGCRICGDPVFRGQYQHRWASRAQ